MIVGVGFSGELFVIKIESEIFEIIILWIVDIKVGVKRGYWVEV